MDDKCKLLQIIRKSLNEIGYSNERIIEEYPIVTKENVIYFDFIAFGHSKIQDTSTSCIAVKYSDSAEQESKIIKDAVYSASPILMVPNKQSVRLWQVGVEKSEKIIELKYDQLGEYFSENRVKFDCEKIVAAKYTIHQISFFEASNLFKYASKINCELLSEEFKNALLSTKQLGLKKQSEITNLTSIVMHIIAAKILNDKLLLDETYVNIHELLDTLSKQYGDYFNKTMLYKYGSKLVERIYNSLRKDLSYRSINNKILGNFYESTLFESDEEKNKKLKEKWGIYYTPSCIVTNLLNAMPIEDIDYRKRYVLDASCGSGSLLIGAYKRLQGLLPVNMSEELQHRYLTDRIMGIDIDKFACEVARLELLLNSIPYGNGWNIYCEDFNKVKVLKSKSKEKYRPYIIIANPPYKEERKAGKIEEKASLFLEKYIDLLENNGLIGIVLPQTFLANKSSKEARKKLLETIRLYEVWLLPKGTFDTNNCATAVIIGKKEKLTADNSFRGKIVTKRSINEFKTKGIFDFEFICKSQREFSYDSEYRIIISPEKKVLDKLCSKQKLSNYVQYTQGIQIPYKKKYPLVSEEEKMGYSKFFRNAKLGIDRYKFNWEAQKETKYIFYDPENTINDSYKQVGLRLREKKRDILEQPKVVVATNSTPGTFERVKAAIDHEGIYVSHSLWCFNGNEKKIPLEVIVAILNSKISNFYIANTNIGMALKSDLLLSIPFPELDTKQSRELVKLVNMLEEDINVEENQRKIDDIIYKGFSLNNEDIQAIERYYSKFTNKKNEISNLNDSNNCKETVEVTGRIVDVDMNMEKMVVNFVECMEEKTINITKEIPGWLLSEQKSFVCRIFEDDFYEDEISIQEVQPLQYIGLTDDEQKNLLATQYNDYEVKIKKENVREGCLG